MASPLQFPQPPPRRGRPPGSTNRPTEPLRADDLLTIREVTGLLKVNRSTLYRRLRRTGAIQPVHIGAKVLYRRTDIERLVQNGGVQ